MLDVDTTWLPGTVPVIPLTRLSGQRFALNPDLMERIEATPDTVISLVDGSKHVVTESVEEVVGLVQHFRASIVALAQLIEVQPPAPTTERDGQPALRLISPGGEQ